MVIGFATRGVYDPVSGTSHKENPGFAGVFFMARI